MADRTEAAEEIARIFAEQRSDRLPVPVGPDIGDHPLSLRFVGDDEANRGHAVPTAFLGQALSTFQQSLTFGYWHVELGAEDRQKVPSQIRDAAMTEVVALEQGSFVVQLRRSDISLSESFNRTVALVLRLARFANESQIGDGVDQAAKELGVRAVGHAGEFFGLVGRNSFDLEMTWQRERRVHAYVEPAEASALAGYLRRSTKSTTEKTVVGTLEMADVAGKFRLVTASEAHYEGSSLVDLAGKELGAQYRARIETTTSIADASAGLSESHKLTAIESTS